MPSAPPFATALPVIAPAAGGMLVVGVELNPGPSLSMTFPMDKLQDVNFRFEFDANGPGTLKLCCTVELAGGKRFHYGGETMTQEPWCLPWWGDQPRGAVGKGHGKGV
jgi:hypothetical protein